MLSQVGEAIDLQLALREQHRASFRDAQHRPDNADVDIGEIPGVRNALQIPIPGNFRNRRADDRELRQIASSGIERVARLRRIEMSTAHRLEVPEESACASLWLRYGETRNLRRVELLLRAIS